MGKVKGKFLPVLTMRPYRA